MDRGSSAPLKMMHLARVGAAHRQRFIRFLTSPFLVSVALPLVVAVQQLPVCVCFALAVLRIGIDSGSPAMTMFLGDIEPAAAAHPLVESMQRLIRYRAKPRGEPILLDILLVTARPPQRWTIRSGPMLPYQLFASAAFVAYIGFPGWHSKPQCARAYLG